MINIIAAVGNNLELGKDNELIWHIPNDLEYFKNVTTGKTVVMGRKTYESIGKALPNRINIVISNSDLNIDKVKVISDYKEVLNMRKDVFIIGGSSIYKLFLPYADRIYLTEINDNKEADVYFPEFDKSLYERQVIETNNYNEIDYSFVIYKRRR